MIGNDEGWVYNDTHGVWELTNLPNHTYAQITVTDGSHDQLHWSVGTDKTDFDSGYVWVQRPYGDSMADAEHLAEKALVAQAQA